MHDESKYHGKLRAKFGRFGTPVHVLVPSCRAAQTVMRWVGGTAREEVAFSKEAARGLDVESEARIPKRVRFPPQSDRWMTPSQKPWLGSE